MLLFLLCAAANDDYVALKALYESTGGSGWRWYVNKNWNMSNTDVCGWGASSLDACMSHCRAVRKCVLNAPCEKERCTVMRASKVYHPMALKRCAE